MRSESNTNNFEKIFVKGGTKFLLVGLTVLLILTAWVLVTPESLTAEAITSQYQGYYYIKVTAHDTDKWDKDSCANSAGYMVVPTKKQDGSAGPTWSSAVTKNQWDSDGGTWTYYDNSTLGGFPDHLRKVQTNSATATNWIKNNNGTWTSNIEFKIYVSKNGNDWTEVLSYSEDTSAGGSWSYTTAVSSDKFPKLNSVGISGNTTVYTNGSTTATYSVTSAKDQYGVAWGFSSVTWSSSNTNLATINNNGEATFKYNNGNEYDVTFTPSLVNSAGGSSKDSITVHVVPCEPLQLNTEKINKPSDKKYYSFTPSSTGEYIFFTYDNDNDPDPGLKVYPLANGTLGTDTYNDDIGDDKIRELLSGSQSNMGSWQSYVTIDLTAGTTYIIKDNRTSSSNTYPMKVCKAVDITFNASGGGTTFTKTLPAGHTLYLGQTGLTRSDHTLLGWCATAYDYMRREPREYTAAQTITVPDSDTTYVALWNPTDPSTVSVNTDYTASVPNAYQITYYKFTPTETRDYIYYSKASASDPYGVLYKASDWANSGSILAYDDDSGNSNSSFTGSSSAGNFFIRKGLTKNTNYLLGVKRYNTGTGDVPFRIEPVYKVEYDLNGASGTAPSNQDKFVGKTLTLSSTEPTRTGYTFQGWSTSSTATSATYAAGGSYTANADAKLYAVWKINTSKLTVNPNGGTWSGSTSSQNFTQNYNTTKSIADPTRTGYQFNEWTLSSGANGTFSSGTYKFGPTNGKNDTLTANWTANTYTVAYNGNGNTGGSTSNSSHTYDQAKNLTANGFTRAYTVTYNGNGGTLAKTSDTATATFNGWATSADGAKVYNNSQSVTNLTATNGETVNLFANWTLGSVTLPSASKAFDSTNHYSFAGWYDASSGGNKIGNAEASYTPTESKTLYAHFTETAHNYNYSQARFNWSDYTCETATATCPLDGGHNTNVTTSVTNAVTTEPGYNTAGVRTYTAKFTKNSVDYTDTKTETIPALNTLINVSPVVGIDEHGVDTSYDVSVSPIEGKNVTGSLVGLVKKADVENDNKLETTNPGSETIRGSHGQIKIENGLIKYTQTGMVFNTAEEFYAVIEVNGTQNHKYSSDTVYTYEKITIVPSQAMLFDDSFDESFGGITYAPENRWTVVNDPTDGAGSVTDRNYDNSVMYSLGKAHKVEVSSADGPNWPSATFTFTGTGFDLISVTNGSSGMFKYSIYSGDSATGNAIYSGVIDTYYGYTYSALYYNQNTRKIVSSSEGASVLYNACTDCPENKQIIGGMGGHIYTMDPNWADSNDQAWGWLEDADSTKSLYQIPVISKDITKIQVKKPKPAEGEPTPEPEYYGYGTYTVKVEAFYIKNLAHSDKNYTLYIDGVRIYNPAATDNISRSKYTDDGELNPVYTSFRQELKDGNLIAIDSHDTGLYEDGVPTGGVTRQQLANDSNYFKASPKNELYLLQNGTISFEINGNDYQAIKIGMKTVDGSATTARVAWGSGSHDFAIGTATEDYYSIKEYVGNNNVTVTITNTGSGVLSLTKLMTSLKPSQSSHAPARVMSVSESTFDEAVKLLEMTEADIAIDEETVETASGEDGTVTITLQTGEDAETIVIRDADGNVVEPDSIDFTIDETGVKNWTIVLTESESGEYTFTLQAEYENGYTGEAEPTTVTVTVSFPEPEDTSIGGRLDKIKGFFERLIEFIRRIINLFR